MNKAALKNEHHIMPLRIYLGVAAALFVFTAATVTIAHINLGGWNAIVAVLIASIKASLVAFIFMHLLYDKKIFLVIFTIAILFLTIFISFTMFDIVSRGNINIETAQPIEKESSKYKQAETDTVNHNNDSPNTEKETGH